MSSEARIFEIGKNRIEALSDGIFAIVITPVHPPGKAENGVVRKFKKAGLT